MDPQIALANRIKLLRKHYRLTIKNFGYGCALSDVTIFKLERGIKTSEKTLQKIIHTYGTTQEWLTTGKGDMLPSGNKELPFDEIEKGHYVSRHEYDKLVSRNKMLEVEVEKLWDAFYELRELKNK